MSRRRHRARKHRVLDKIRDELKEPHRAAPPNKKQPAPAGEVSARSQAGIATPSRSRQRSFARSRVQMKGSDAEHVRRAPDLGLVRQLMTDTVG